jgi:hypothetical protein
MLSASSLGGAGLELAEAGSVVQAARAVLDRFGVANRLQHVRRYVWRGGTLQFAVHADRSQRPDVYYELSATWDAPVLERAPSTDAPTGTPRASTNAARSAIEHHARPIVDGLWTRGSAGYVLRVGIDLAVPSAMYIKANRLQSFVPFVGRPDAQVEHAVHVDLNAYVTGFLSTARPVPEAARADAEHLRRLGLTDV